ncbi:hypothetical protein [Paractinoplanes lichenicola]|uniref:Tat pathway signal sequence domain protein n=1 Tax=Paractinoplanes lichenicola TaxID=2802976 RepID=A0ABS1W4F4_9ACTN|nr:hypothetical protein [Actinoplanes lichenicola]MBL7261609.1 hypothetical protein [Actinoplanes lichenicola]
MKKTRKNLVRAGIAALLSLAGVLPFAVPASADVSTARRTFCDLAGRRVHFTFWIYNEDPLTWQVYRVAWNTDFTPSRLVISWRDNLGNTPVIRAWGGSASTLHDVARAGDTGNSGVSWEQSTHSVASTQGVLAAVYLNDGTRCVTPLVRVTR